MIPVSRQRCKSMLLAITWPSFEMDSLTNGVVIAVAVVVGILALIELCGLRFIPNDQVGIVEKRWSLRGSVPEGRIMALNGEAGYQADVLRGGFHVGLWRIMYRIHQVPLITVSQG